MGAVVAEAQTVARSRYAVPVTLTCIGLTATVTLLASRLDPASQARWEQAISTDVWHLTHQPVRVLLASPWWAVGGPLWQWVLLLAATVGTLERSAGWRVALPVVVAGHVVGTLVSEGILGWQVHAGAQPASAVHRVDVGISYVAASAAAAALIVADGWLRGVAAVGAAVVAVDMLDPLGALHADVDAVGHLTAILVGAAAGVVVLARRRRRRPPVAAR